MKLLPLAAALVAAAGLAQAQQKASGGLEPAPRLVEMEEQGAIVAPFGMSVNEIEDTQVYDAGGTEVGEVTGVLSDEPGHPVAFAVEAGGFLGIGEREIVVPIAKLRWESGRFFIDMTSEEIAALPEWNG